MREAWSSTSPSREPRAHAEAARLAASASASHLRRVPVTGPHVVVVEDDTGLRTVLRRGLEEADFRVTAVGTAAEALAAAARGDAELLLVDVGLPDADGRDLVQALRAAGHDAPVLFLTARDALVDRLAGFAAGGDDYLTKPFALAEVVARLHALGRRTTSPPAPGQGALLLDPARHVAALGGVETPLTPTEFRILACLAANHGRTTRRQALVEAAWPHGAVVHGNTLDVYMARVRRKLAGLPGAPTVHTRHGVGYELR